jgi:hypothetical protein
MTTSEQPEINSPADFLPMSHAEALAEVERLRRKVESQHEINNGWAAYGERVKARTREHVRAFEDALGLERGRGYWYERMIDAARVVREERDNARARSAALWELLKRVTSWKRRLFKALEDADADKCHLDEQLDRARRDLETAQEVARFALSQLVFCVQETLTRLIAALLDPRPCVYGAVGCTVHDHIGMDPCPHDTARELLADLSETRPASESKACEKTCAYGECGVSGLPGEACGGCCGCRGGCVVEHEEQMVEAQRGDAPTVWDSSVAPGGLMCAPCGTPVESEPCREHQPRAYAEAVGETRPEVDRG